MSLPDFNSELDPVPTLTVFEARFTGTATSATDAMHVTIPALDDGRTTWPVQWTPRPGPIYPHAGDLAAVTEALALDGDSTSWWVLGWTPTP